jgi:hypothetical protein
MLPDGTKVKHRKLNYIGYIEGITKIKGIFTGNTNCDWQYRIRIHGQDIRKIAPEDDLEVIGIIATREACLDKARIILTLTASGREPDFNRTACIFQIEIKSKIAVPILYEINQWVYTKVRSKTALRKLKRISENEFRLEIKGLGYDNRCRWCRTFRTSLETKIVNSLGEGTFYQDGFCFFERESENL